MKVFKSFYNSNKSICLIILGLSIVALPACEKSRLKIRPAVATTPKTAPNTPRPAINNEHDHGYDHNHYPEEHEPVIVEETTPDRYRDRVRESVKERETRINTPREQKPTSLGGIPVTTVNNHDNKKQTVAHGAANGADLNCQSKGCTQPPKEDDNGELPPGDIPDTKKPDKEKPVTDKPVIDKPTIQEPVAEKPVIEEPVEELPAENTRVTVLDKTKSFDHFHLLLVIDKGAIHINKHGKQVDNDAIRVQRTQILNTVESFLTGFNNLRPQMIDSEKGKEYSFTLGLVAGSNDPRYIGQFFNDTKKEFNTKDIAGVHALLNEQMDNLAQDNIDPDKTHPITVNSNFVSLQKFIESDPESIDDSKFLSENTPTVVLTIGNKFSDRCVIETLYEKDPDCDARHDYGQILKTLIKRKVYGSNTPGIFAPVTFKHIFLDGHNNTVDTYKRDNKKSRVSYDAESHGVRFAAKSLVKQTIDKPAVDFTDLALIVNGRYDENCLVDKDNKYITTTSIGISKAEAMSFDQSVANIPADRMCKVIETSEFNKAIVNKLYQEELELLED